MNKGTENEVGPLAPVRLRLARITSYSGGVATPREWVSDELKPSWGWTSCRRSRHSPAPTPKGLVPTHGVFLDCACNVECPRCGAAVGSGCTTLDGGGMSGGGYLTKTHAARVKVSQWCQQRLDGSRTVCDTGEHDWQREGEHEALCALCGRKEPLSA